MHLMSYILCSFFKYRSLYNMNMNSFLPTMLKTPPSLAYLYSPREINTQTRWSKHHNDNNFNGLFQCEVCVVCTLLGERETTGLGGCEAGRCPLVVPILDLNILLSRSIIYFQQIGGQRERCTIYCLHWSRQILKLIFRFSSFA